MSPRHQVTLAFFTAVLVACAAQLALPAVPASAQQPGQQPAPARYKVPPVYPPRLDRPGLTVPATALPRGVAGRLPRFDGQGFSLQVRDRLPEHPTPERVRALVDTLLAALKWSRKPDELRLARVVTLPGADSEFVGERVKDAQERSIERLRGRDGQVTPTVADSIRAEVAREGWQAMRRGELYVFEQVFSDVPIENSGVRAMWRQGPGLTAVSGRVFRAVQPGNARRLDAQQAIRAARGHFQQYDTLHVTESAPKPSLVLLPYGRGFRFAWRLDVASSQGPYRAWVDAQSGEMLRLDPLFFSYQQSGQGRIFTPDPNSGTRVQTFEVDAASGGQYRLLRTGVLDVNNSGADGQCSGDLTISSGGSSTADFDVAPINGTVVERTNQANYNCRFQDVNAYGWVSWLRTLWQFEGSQPFPDITVTVNHSNPCGFGLNNACGGGSSVTFGIGAATTGTSTSCSDLFNTAIDATVIAHELGHVLNGLQYGAGGGTLTGYINEGMADYWSHSTHNIPIIAGWSAHNCAAPSQGGWLPREAEATDIFPERLSTATESHGIGQMVAWALWDARREMDDADTFGPLLLNVSLLNALTLAGISGVQPGLQPERIHDTYRDLLDQLATQYSPGRRVHKVLTGFARAGIFLSPADAVIDIDDDYLVGTGPTRPTFTVWTGEDYSFNADETVNTGSQPCNTGFTVEVANDAAFTQNLVSSGVQSGVTAGAGCAGTWSPTPPQWNTLKHADQIYFRATTTNATGGNVRQTASPGNGTLTGVAPAKAIINESGEEECCAPAGTALILLIPFLFGIDWRRRRRRTPDVDEGDE